MTLPLGGRGRRLNSLTPTNYFIIINMLINLCLSQFSLAHCMHTRILIIRRINPLIHTDAQVKDLYGFLRRGTP